LEIKDRHKEHILFFRLGDFYEMFFDDAKIAADVLGLTLTSRETGRGKAFSKAPMCGMPHHAAEAYIEKLVKAGHSVALCEQTGGSKDGLAAREVTQIYTPGTFFSDEGSGGYIMALTAKSGDFGLAYCDVSTGEFAATSFKHFGSLSDEIAKINPIEMITCLDFAKGYDALYEAKTLSSWAFSYDIAHASLCEHFGITDLASFGAMDAAAICAAGGLLEHLRQTQFNNLSHIHKIAPYSVHNHMRLDKYTRRNLEIFETMMDKQRTGSLLWALDETKTPMGRRLLRKWLEQPLMKIGEIKSRQEAVAEFAEDEDFSEHVRENLNKIGDLERFCAKLVYKRINGRDLLALGKSLWAVQELFDVDSPDASLNGYLFEEADVLTDIFESIDGRILDTAGNSINEGGIFAAGYDAELDEMKLRQNQLSMEILAYETKIKDETSIKQLKISQNKVFGYYIEIPNSQRAKVSADFVLLLSLTNAQRYITDTLKELESKILEASQNLIDFEFSLFVSLRDTIAAKVGRIKQTAHVISHIDALQSLGKVAKDNDYVMPSFNEDGVIDIRQSRHPVVERLFDGCFVPNDIYLNDSDQKIAIITGPNMAGKSTYMRQAALCVIMAQIGSFIPAVYANIAICDSVLTRVGAADDLARGQSTFMVEMSEVAHIIDNATNQSLILLDEVGRGTGTTDGLAIAMATVEHIAEKIGAKTFFATHYHEMVMVEGNVDGVVNLSMDIEKINDDDIKFLWKVVKGGTNKSHGIYVAKMAGLPEELIERSREIHEKLVVRGVFDDGGDETADAASSRAVEYAAIKEKIQRYRLFLDELGDEQIDNDEVKRILGQMREL